MNCFQKKKFQTVICIEWTFADFAPRHIRKLISADGHYYVHRDQQKKTVLCLCASVTLQLFFRGLLNEVYRATNKLAITLEQVEQLFLTLFSVKTKLN